MAWDRKFAIPFRALRLLTGVRIGPESPVHFNILELSNIL